LKLSKFLGGYVSMTFIVLVDLLGLEKITNYLGILVMFQGIAVALGPPLAGFLYHTSKSYVLSFAFGGSAIAISGAMCFFIPYIKCHKENDCTQKDQVTAFIKENNAAEKDKF